VGPDGSGHQRHRTRSAPDGGLRHEQQESRIESGALIHFITPAIPRIAAAASWANQDTIVAGLDVELIATS
jgi:hypothetical protein